MYMLRWDDRYGKLLSTLGINTILYCGYVDDVVCVVKAINKGWQHNPNTNKMEYCSKRASEDTRSDEARTAETLSSIANTLDKEIQFTVDTPERNTDGKMAMLDLKIWIGKIH